MTGIKIKVNKNGKQMAYYYSHRQLRWFPMPLVEAELLLATEKAYLVPADSMFA